MKKLSDGYGYHLCMAIVLATSSQSYKRSKYSHERGLLSLFLTNGIIILIFTVFASTLSGFWPFSFKPPLASLGGVIIHLMSESHKSSRFRCMMLQNDNEILRPICCRTGQRFFVTPFLSTGNNLTFSKMRTKRARLKILKVTGRNKTMLMFLRYRSRYDYSVK